MVLSNKPLPTYLVVSLQSILNYNLPKLNDIKILIENRLYRLTQNNYNEKEIVISCLCNNRKLEKAKTESSEGEKSAKTVISGVTENSVITGVSGPLNNVENIMKFDNIKFSNLNEIALVKATGDLMFVVNMLKILYSNITDDQQYDNFCQNIQYHEHEVQKVLNIDQNIIKLKEKMIKGQIELNNYKTISNKNIGDLKNLLEKLKAEYFEYRQRLIMEYKLEKKLLASNVEKKDLEQKDEIKELEKEVSLYKYRIKAEFDVNRSLCMEFKYDSDNLQHFEGVMMEDCDEKRKIIQTKIAELIKFYEITKSKHVKMLDTIEKYKVVIKEQEELHLAQQIEADKRAIMDFNALIIQSWWRFILIRCHLIKPTKEKKKKT